VFVQADGEHVAVVEYGAKNLRISVGQSSHLVSGEMRENGRIDVVIDGQRVAATVIDYRGHAHLFLEGKSCVFAYVDPLEKAAEGHSAESSLRAPMPGRIIAQSVQPGEPIEKGAPLMVLEAMKMECTIYAPAAGRVESFHFAVGDQVTEGAELLHFDRGETQADEN
jgi:3-methylcrotonyl-CoA carboxylase alpha subunit